MNKYLAAYAATAVVMLALDALWLGVVARPVYQSGIGHLMAEQPNLPVAMLFYAVYALGLVVFAVAPNGAAAGVHPYADGGRDVRLLCLCDV